MMWSKLRVQVRANLVEELRARIDFDVAVYRKSHDSDYGRAWISLDGHPIGNWSCFEQFRHRVLPETLQAQFQQYAVGRQGGTLLTI
jgi:hypothetical protein